MDNENVEPAWGRIAENLNIRIYEQARVETLRGPVMEMVQRAAAQSGLVSTAWMEESLIWWVIAGRLEKVVGKNGLLAAGGLELDTLRRDVLPTLEALAKARERYRNAVKELMKEAGETKTGGGLASMMMPIWEKAEGVFENVVEQERRKNAVARKESNGTGNSTLRNDI
jgi:hypothetical protein